MAVFAGLIAELSHIDLKDGDASGGERGETGLLHGIGKRVSAFLKDTQLFTRRRQRTFSREHGQGHGSQ
jgi:hypothetical protein